MFLPLVHVNDSHGFDNNYDNMIFMLLPVNLSWASVLYGMRYCSACNAGHRKNDFVNMTVCDALI